MSIKSPHIFKSAIALTGLAFTTSLTLWSTSVKALTLVTDRTALNANDRLDFSKVPEPSSLFGLAIAVTSGISFLSCKP
jgi:hypothetical protein